MVSSNLEFLGDRCNQDSVWIGYTQQDITMEDWQLHLGDICLIFLYGKEIVDLLETSQFSKQGQQFSTLIF